MSRADVEASETAMVRRRVEACPDPAAAWELRALLYHMARGVSSFHQVSLDAFEGGPLWIASPAGIRYSLLVLSEKCAGWWTWPDEMETQPVFVTLTEWAKIREARK